MAHLVILTHVLDEFLTCDYLLRSFMHHWTRMGHRVSVAAGLDDMPYGDIAILHVDLSLVPTAYAEAAKRYPIVLNGAALDIRKKRVSRYLVNRTDDWDGPVIVKTDLNHGGRPELRSQQKAIRAGMRSDTDKEVTYHPGAYPILPSIKDVSELVWNKPGLVVERFLPEQDPRGYWMRAWVFFGEQERCTRYLGSHPVVKSGNTLAREPVPVPEELRAERRRLGFDYGKFDFVVHNGQVILFDANKTPGAPPSTPEMEASNARLASGIEAWLRT